MKIIPLADRVVIKAVEVEETTKGGLILTGSAKEKPQVAEVIAVGPGGVVDGKEVGFALFFHNFSTFLGRAGLYLEDLFVLPEYRGKGYGKAILKKLAEIAVERKCGRLEWSCLDWNKPSIDFYLSLDAEPMSDWTVYRLTGDRLKKLAQ